MSIIQNILNLKQSRALTKLQTKSPYILPYK
jgi:hypothetical protein